MQANRFVDTLHSMHISFVIPTRNRQHELGYTLGQLERLSLDELGGESEVVIVDNGSDSVMDVPNTLRNGIQVSMVSLGENIGAGARNIGAEHALGDWVIMLDDDSNLCTGEVGDYLAGVDAKVAAVGGEILLPTGQHESGGLPEVVVGCGCAIRRDAFLDVGGYDVSFGYYAEEYDLCAKLIAAGHSIMHTMAIRFEHRKCAVGRDMDEILYRLVRNNGWVIQRHAPDAHRNDALKEMYTRYQQIAINEHAMAGYRRGCDELERTIKTQRPVPLSMDEWDRFVGNAALRTSLLKHHQLQQASSVSIVGPARGKGLGQICSALESLGCVLDTTNSPESVQVIGTLSPGPMLDAKIEYRDAISPWMVEDRLIEDSIPLSVHS